MRGLKLLLSVLAISAFLGAPAFASVVNVTTSTTLFYDNFESAPGVSNAAYPDASGSYKPVATVGAWAFTEPATDRIQVTDFASPGAYQGNNYLRLVREPNEGAVNANEIFTPQTTVGQTIDWKQMVYVPSTFVGSGGPLEIAGLSGASTYRWDLYMGYTSSGPLDVESYNATGWPPNSTGLSVTPDTWQLWEIKYKIGDSTMSLSVGGNTNASVPIYPGGSLDRIALNLDRPTGSAWSGMMYDEVGGPPVPEPSTLTLLACGLAGLLCYAWRKRK
jgi:hypothetical protein